MKSWLKSNLDNFWTQAKDLGYVWKLQRGSVCVDKMTERIGSNFGTVIYYLYDLERFLAAVVLHAYNPSSEGGWGRRSQIQILHGQFREHLSQRKNKGIGIYFSGRAFLGLILSTLPKKVSLVSFTMKMKIKGLHLGGCVFIVYPKVQAVMIWSRPKLLWLPDIVQGKSLHPSRYLSCIIAEKAETICHCLLQVSCWGPTRRWLNRGMVGNIQCSYVPVPRSVWL